MAKREKSIRTKPDNLVRARKALKTVWGQARLRGRCWGLRHRFGDNPFAGSNITMAKEGEVVTISLAKSGELIVHEFCRCNGGTKLGNEVIAGLKTAKLPIRGER